MDKNKFLVDLSESPMVEFGRVDFSDQSECQRVFSAIWALESQVNNGGFLQYFSSSDFDTAEFAPEALRRIGANQCAAIVDQALAALPAQPLPKTQDECEALVASLGDDTRERFSELDDQFITYPDSLTDLLFAFVAANPNVFGKAPR